MDTHQYRSINDDTKYSNKSLTLMTAYYKLSPVGC